MMDAPTPQPPKTGPAPTAGERLWRNFFFILSAVLAGMALLQFDAGQFAHGLGDLGASVLMLSLMSQFPFLRAIVRASAEDGASPERIRRRREELLQQAAQLKAAHPWSDVAGRTGWVLLGISLVLRVAGAG
jgi:hypothetical protein